MDRRLTEMTDGQCEEMLRGMLPELEQKEIARIIEDNFYAIKADIRELIELECPQTEQEAFVEEIKEETLNITNNRYA